MSEFESGLDAARKDRDSATEWDTWTRENLVGQHVVLCETPVRLADSVQDFLRRMPSSLMTEGFLLTPPKNPVVKMDQRQVPDHRKARILCIADRSFPWIPYSGEVTKYGPGFFQTALQKSAQKANNKRALATWARIGVRMPLVITKYGNYDYENDFYVTADAAWCSVSPESDHLSEVLNGLVSFTMKHHLP